MVIHTITIDSLYRFICISFSGISLEQSKFITQKEKNCLWPNVHCKNLKNKDIETIHRLALEVKQDAKVGIEFMKSWEREYMFKREGHLEGRREGILEGEYRGQTKVLAELIIKKLKRNLSFPEIVEQLEEDETILQPIYNIVLKYAPDYDLEKILNELCPETNNLQL